MVQTFKELDMRPILRNGGEPFNAIMEAVNSLAPEEGLRLIATFRPDPLLRVLAQQGFSSEAIEMDDGEWHILFRPGGRVASEVTVSVGAEEAATWPEPLWQLDLTRLQPPEPMEKVLSRTELMEPGEVLFAVFGREPVFLMPELEKRGHQWAGGFDDSGSAYRMLIRIGEGGGA